MNDLDLSIEKVKELVKFRKEHIDIFFYDICVKAKQITLHDKIFAQTQIWFHKH